MTGEEHSKATMYRRWNVKYTQKDRWHPADMTVSTTYQEGCDPGHERMVHEARQAMQEAQAACDELNAQETQDATIAQLKEAGTQ